MSLPCFHVYRTDYGDVRIGPKVCRYLDTIHDEWFNFERDKRLGRRNDRQRVADVLVTIKTAAAIAMANGEELRATQ